MLQAIYPIVWPRILHAEWNPWEEFSSVCPRLEPLSDFRYDAAMRAKNGEVSQATDLQQTPYPRVIHGRYCIKVKKAELKLRYSHKTPVCIEELKSFVGIVYGLLPPVSDGIVIDIVYAKKANFVYVGSVSTRALSKECCKGFEVAEFKGFANTDVGPRIFSVFRGSWIRVIEINRTQNAAYGRHWMVSPTHEGTATER
jgi:hypothetical protein